MNFAGETAGVIGLSYFFHKTGHHRLERAVSMLNIGSSAAAVDLRPRPSIKILQVDNSGNDASRRDHQLPVAATRYPKGIEI